jgi:23S rRNA A1618 N6-methylase RlmF
VQWCSPAFFWHFSAVRKKAEKEKKNRGLRSSKKGERKRKRKKEKGGVEKYRCLMNEEGIVTVNLKKILFTLLSFLLK